MTGMINTFNPSPKSILGLAGNNGSTSNTTHYLLLTDVLGTLANGTETVVDLPITFAFRVTRVRATVTANTKDAATTVAFRDDAASIGTLTINAAATGDFDSGALNTTVAAGSKCNFIRNATASISGAITFVIYIEYESM